MKAAVMRANNAPLEIEEVDIDHPGPGEVLVKTSALRASATAIST